MLNELNELNRVRLAEDLTYQALADRIGLDDGHLVRLLKGQTSQPTDRTLYKIRKFLGSQRKRRKGASA